MVNNPLDDNLLDKSASDIDEDEEEFVDKDEVDLDEGLTLPVSTNGYDDSEDIDDELDNAFVFVKDIKKEKQVEPKVEKKIEPKIETFREKKEEKPSFTPFKESFATPSSEKKEEPKNSFTSFVEKVTSDKKEKGKDVVFTPFKESFASPSSTKEETTTKEKTDTKKETVSSENINSFSEDKIPDIKTMSDNQLSELFKKKMLEVIFGTAATVEQKDEKVSSDEDPDIELDYGTVGEICVNGPSVMLGYINQEKETDEVLKKHCDGKIWLHTGDLGYMEADGVIHYQSRLKRMIISNGYNIYPLELESIINKCKYVEQTIVVAMKHKIKGEIPKAVIVLKKGVVLNHEIEKEIKKYCETNIPKYKLHGEYEFRENLPVTKIGKIDYKKL